MTTTPVLALPNFAEPFIIEIDASNIGIGAVLMQHGQPMAYLNKALAQQYKTLSIYEKDFFGSYCGSGEVETISTTPRVHHSY